MKKENGDTGFQETSFSLQQGICISVIASECACYGFAISAGSLKNAVQAGSKGYTFTGQRMFGVRQNCVVRFSGAGDCPEGSEHGCQNGDDKIKSSHGIFRYNATTVFPRHGQAYSR